MDSISSFLGSFWFGVMLAALGYIAGNLIPLATVAKWIPTKKN
jgi:hypothetical protein|tara:strand:+ start:893 stop:1021 length:129 start_codon:yes stop_codon:yes gene_type:complete